MQRRPATGDPAQEQSWSRLLALLEPVHDRAAVLARRLARSPADGDDLYQEAVLRAHDRLSTLRDDTRFPAWFYAVLLSVHRSRARRAFWRRFLPLEEMAAGGVEPAGEDGTEWEEERQAAARASRALATLPAVQREAIVLFEIESFSIEEIAALQQVTLSAVKSRLARARERLRKHYQRLGLTAAAMAAPAPEGARARVACRSAGRGAT